MDKSVVSTSSVTPSSKKKNVVMRSIGSMKLKFSCNFNTFCPKLLFGVLQEVCYDSASQLMEGQRSYVRYFKRARSICSTEENGPCQMSKQMRFRTPNFVSIVTVINRDANCPPKVPASILNSFNFWYTSAFTWFIRKYWWWTYKLLFSSSASWGSSLFLHNARRLL